MTTPNVIAMWEEWANNGGTLTVGGADITQPYFYLAGGMTGIPQFNFPAFHTAAAKLREWGYNVVNPAELDDEIERAKAETSEDGYSTLAGWANCLKRDLPFVWDDKCVGVICIDGWEHSGGARLETYVANAMKKPLFAIVDEGLIVIPSRKKAIEAAGVDDD